MSEYFKTSQYKSVQSSTQIRSSVFEIDGDKRRFISSIDRCCVFVYENVLLRWTSMYAGVGSVYPGCALFISDYHSSINHLFHYVRKRL